MAMLENSKVLQLLYFFGIIAIPFDAVPGLGVIGELAHEGSFYFFICALGYASMLVVGSRLQRATVPASRSYWVTLCAKVLLGVIILSGLVNLNDILGANIFHGRSGLPKFITSLCVIGYGLALAWLTSSVVGNRWYQRVIVPCCISASICVVVCVFEFITLRGGNIALFNSFYAFIHSGAEAPTVLWDGSLNRKVLEAWDTRLRSVSFEPPAFGNFAGLIWPWLACAIPVTHGSRRALHIALLVIFSALIGVAQARTGWLLLATDVTMLGLLWLVFLPKNGRPNSLWIALIVTGMVSALLCGGVYYSLSYDQLVNTVVNSQSISDLTRFAYQVSAFKIFGANPFFGVGLGQFAFKVSEAMPSWGFLSSEIKASMIYPDAPWPNTYSLYARIGAEIGIVGLLGWIGMWICTFVRLHQAVLVQIRASGIVPWEYCAIFNSIVAILVSGLTTDTFRTPWIWITIGAASNVIGHRRTQRARSALRLRSTLDPSMTVRQSIGVGSSVELSGQSTVSGAASNMS